MVLQGEMNKTLRYCCMPRETISNDILSLSCIQPEHIESIRQWRNVQMSVLRQKAEIDEQQQVKYFNAYIWPTLNQTQPANILLSLHRGETLIGYGGLVHIAWEDLRAEVSFLLDPALVGSDSVYSDMFNGFLELISDFAFYDLQFNRLFTETWRSRTLHIETLEAASFHREGIMKEHTIQCGVPTDSVIHGRLAPGKARKP